jgi:hypothetical protein
MTREEVILTALMSNKEMDYNAILNELKIQKIPTTESILSKQLRILVHQEKIIKPSKNKYRSVDFKSMNIWSYVGSKEDKRINLEEIALAVVPYFECSLEDLKSKTRKRNFVDARKCYAYIARKNSAKYTLERIGAFINKSHDCAIYYITQCEDLKACDLHFADVLNKIEIQLKTDFKSQKLLNEDQIGFYYDKPHRLVKRCALV